MAGGTMMARWEAPSPGFVYCFEQQPLPGALKRGVCIRRDFSAKSIHVERGKGAPRAPHLSPSPGAGSWRGFNRHPWFLPQEHWKRRHVTASPCTAGPWHGAGPPSPCSTTTPATVRMETRSIRAWFNCKKGGSRNAAPFFLHTHHPPPPSRAASLAVPIHINTSARDDAIVLQWSPSPRAACPGVLAKYLICHAAKGDNVTCEWDLPPVPMGQEEGAACNLQAAA